MANLISRDLAVLAPRHGFLPGSRVPLPALVLKRGGLAAQAEEACGCESEEGGHEQANYELPRHRGAPSLVAAAGRRWRLTVALHIVKLGNRSALASKASRYLGTLCVQGYVDAARAFESESGTSPGLDLNAITDRMEIRKAVQSGDVEEAIERTNDLDPEVCRRRRCQCC